MMAGAVATCSNLIVEDLALTASSAESVKTTPNARTVSGDLPVDPVAETASAANVLRMRTVETVKRGQRASLGDVGVMKIMIVLATH